MSDWEREICARVKTIRESIRWSQSAFAAQLSITRDQLASIEYGRTPLRYDIAWRIRQAFGISLRWLEEGFGVADNFEHDALPIPTATGLPKRALLSAVVRKFNARTGENLIPFGPEGDTTPADATTDKPPAETSEPATIADVFAAVQQTLQGQEAETGQVDISNRECHAMLLKILVDSWVARIPLGHVNEFADKLNNTAEEFIRSFPPDAPSDVDRRSDQIMWERIRGANARKILIASDFSKKELPEPSIVDKMPSVKSQMENLLAALRPLTEEPGKKTELAKFLHAPLASVSRWLSGEREPGGETALRMLEWVERQKRRQ